MIKTKYAVAILAILALTLLLSGESASAQGDATPASSVTPTPLPDDDGGDGQGVPQFPPFKGKINPPKHTNMDSLLNQIVESVRIGAATPASAAESAPLRSGESVAVTLHIDGDSQAVADFLASNGGSPRNIGADYVEAYVPISLLPQASRQAGVIRVQAIVPPRPMRGAIVSEGVSAHNSLAWNEAGYTGEGVKVGVIDAGFVGLPSLMGTELPANVVARCYTDIGVFTSNIDDCGDSDHGTGVAEAMLDIAPNVELYIADLSSPGDMLETVRWMVSQDVKVFNHSIGWIWDGPGDGTSPNGNSPLRTVDVAVDGGAIWLNSAGNSAEIIWLEDFDPDSNSRHRFDGSDVCNDVRGFSGNFSVQLRWDDTWQGATRDLDLYLLDVNSGEVVATSEDAQSGHIGHIPSEFLSYHTPDSGGRYCLIVQHFAGAQPGWIQLDSHADFHYARLEHYTLNGSITNPAESANPGLLAVGAAPWYDTATIESFSSRGPTPDGRLKPEIVGADGNGSATWVAAYGTSLSSPHLAGLAALVRQRFPEYSPQDVARYLKRHAAPRGSVPNNTWGYGFARLPSLATTQCPADCQTLLAAKDTLVGSGDARLNWNAELPMSDWTGVAIDSAGRVTSLRLVERDLSGSIPPELGSLSNLRSLNITGNRLTGGIPPELGSLSNLRTLVLVANELAGSIPPELGSLSNLQSLELGGNRMTGGIPPELGSLSNLQSLDLRGNRLTGSIPPELGSLSNLLLLDIGVNELTGGVPPELGSLSNLQVLVINANKLTGMLPHSLTILKNLLLLLFDGNAGLCAPTDEAFRAWLANIFLVNGLNCVGPAEGPVLSGAEEVSVAENSPRSTIIASYHATAPNADTISYALRGADAKSFTIDKATGDLATLESLDYESNAPCPRAGCEVTVIASDADTPDISMDVTITVTDDINDSVTTMNMQKANPVPGHAPGDPNTALADVKITAAGQTAVPERPDDLPATTGTTPVNFVKTSWANWGTVLRIEVTSESPDPNCGNGNQCVIIIVEGRESDDILELEAYRSNYQENRFITAVMPVSGEGDMVETIVGSDNADEIAPLYKHPADGGVPRLKVDENDFMTIEFDILTAELGIDNEAPNFFGFRPEHGETVDDGDVDYLFTVTDSRSGFPNPEDLPDNDGDKDYIAVVAFISDEQCQTPIRYELNGEPVWNADYLLIEGLHAESEIACRNSATTETRLIVDDNDFDEIDHGLDVETTLVLPANGKRFVTFIACDTAGNCAAYDPDVSDPTVTLSEITIETRIDPDECIQRFTGDATISASWTSESDCVSENSPDGSAYYARFYTFTLSEPADVTITLTSEINTYLYLMSGAGKDGEALYESGDFIGFGTNSLIEATLAPGEYTIEATTYDSGVEGDFTLTVSSIVAAPPPPISDREALKALYDATDGANWTNSANWLSDAPLSEWHGITTDDNGSVSRINIEGNNLTGTIPSELSSLDALELLWLGDNNLTGTIPSELGSLTNLKELSLRDNRITGTIPSELGSLTDLEHLNLDSNDLTGHIPAELGNLVNLRNLGSSHNNLTGHIPAELGDLTNLEHIHLHDNNLTGPIPPELGSLDNLATLRVSGNNLTGPIPTELGNLEDLRYLSLSHNRLTGGVPPELGNLYDLETLTLDGNDLAGELPQSLTNLTLMEQFYFDANAGLCAPDNAYFQAWLQSIADFRGDACGTTSKPPTDECADVLIGDDAISGAWKSNCESTNNPGNYAHYYTFRLSEASKVTVTLESTTDTYLYLLSGAGKDGEALYENDDFIDFGTNSLIVATLTAGEYTIEATTHDSGAVGDFTLTVSGIARQSVTKPDQLVLAALYNSTGGANWTNSTNWLTNAPLGDWVGVDTNDDGRVTGINLEANNLSGQLPSEFGDLVFLERINVSSNQLTGELPQSLTNLTPPEYFYFDANAGLCAPGNASFQAWLQSIADFRGDTCDTPPAPPEPPPTSECMDALTGDATISGAWTSGCVSENNSDGKTYYARFYTFTLNNPADVTITLTSDINTYLYLMSGTGKDGEVLHETADPDGTNSRIAAALAPGDYTIEATTHDSGAVGDFTLTVSGITQQPAANPDRAGLAALYNSTGGANWTNSTNWLTNAPLGDWVGVDTNDDERVTGINLEANNLSGQLPSEFGDLIFLERINVSSNQLTGELPQSLTNLTLLEYFYFDNNAGLCAPVDASFQAWLQSIADFRGDICDTPPEPPPTSECMDALTGDATISDTWTSGCVSENNPDGKTYYARFYTFTLSNPADVTITLTSDINTYLYLMSGTGKDGEVLHENDDFIGFGTNSRIVATLAAGAYTIEATTYDIGAVGDFTLTVSGIGDAPLSENLDEDAQPSPSQ